MVKQALVVATILTAALILGVGGLAVYRQSSQLKAAQAELAEVKVLNSQAKERAAVLERDLVDGRLRIESLQQQAEQEISKTKSLMEDQMREALKSREVTISELEGRLTLNILDRILFDSAAADIKPEGRQVLDQIANVLTNHPNRQILVVGHTDNRPIRGSMRFPSNWELSTARANAAVRYLSENAGVPPAMLGAIGYGEHHPIADNETPEGRARNRRIAIVIMPEGFRPFESSEPATTTPPPATTSTNTPPAVAPPPAMPQTNRVPAAPVSAPPPAKAPAREAAIKVSTNFTRLQTPLQKPAPATSLEPSTPPAQ